eukprot:14843317-Alexandrium_andersonii.AAC.1
MAGVLFGGGLLVLGVTCNSQEVLKVAQDKRAGIRDRDAVGEGLKGKPDTVPSSIAEGLRRDAKGD